MKFSPTNLANSGTESAAIEFRPLWSTISLIHPKKQFVLDLYFTRENDSRSQPSHVEVLGMAFGIYF